MGRKIPGRKHKGVRDIDKQHRLKLESIKDKINAPPSNPDDQQIPKSLSHIIHLKETAKSGEVKHKRKLKKKQGPVTSHPNGVRIKLNKSGRPEKPTPVFTQNPGESDKHFMWRVNKICSSVIREAEFEDKYRVDIKRNTETGEVEKVVRRKKDELEVLLKQAKKNTKQSNNKKSLGTNKPRLTKSQKRTQKLKEKKERRADLELDEFKNYKDNVKFGEVVHEPPSLSTPRHASSKETSRPGKKKLLLKSLIENDGMRSVKPKSTTDEKLKKTADKVIDKKAKRKDLPNALRRQLEKQQEEVVKAYKLLKSKKYAMK